MVFVLSAFLGIAIFAWVLIAHRTESVSSALLYSSILAIFTIFLVTRILLIAHFGIDNLTYFLLMVFMPGSLATLVRGHWEEVKVKYCISLGALWVSVLLMAVFPWQTEPKLKNPFSVYSAITSGQNPNDLYSEAEEGDGTISEGYDDIESELADE